VSAIPRGELRLASFSSVAEDQAKLELATTLFQRADAALFDAETYHKQLSSAVGDGAYDIAIPPPAAPGATGLKQFVEDLSVDGSIGDISGKLNLLAILEKSYEWFGFHDFFMVIRELEPVGCPDGAQGDCRRVVAQYWPSPMRPDEFVGTKEELGRDLAVLVLRGQVRNKGDEWRRVAAADVAPPFLMAPETPSSMAALEATAKGMEILTLGESHPDCLDQAELACIDLAREAFRLSIERENTVHPAAAFGQALIELDAALRAARDLDPALTVESHLSKAEVRTSRARQSEFLRLAMDRSDLGPRFSLLDLHGLAPGETSIDVARRFACSLADYRRANWQGCISEIGELQNFPLPLQPYVEAALIDASLTEAADDDSFKTQLDALDKRLSSSSGQNTSDADHLLGRVMLKHACTRTNTLDDDGFAELVRRATDNAPHGTARQEAMIQAAACRPTQEFPSEADLQPLIASMEAMPDGKERHGFELLLSQYRIRQGQLDAALDLAKRALQLPWTGPYVRKAPEFAAMIASPDHGRGFIEASFTTATLSDLESCYRLE
jgi:hypothetical protein